MKTTLSKAVVEALAPEEKDYVIWDDEVVGFGVRVRRSTGSRTFIIQYRYAGGAPRRETIGLYPEWTVSRARDRAEVLLEIGRRGIDRKAIATAEAAAEAKRAHDLNFNNLSDAYLRLYVDMSCKPATRRTYRTLLDRHLRPAFGHRDASTIGTADILEWKASMTAHPSTWNRSLTLFVAILNYAASVNLLPATYKSPVAGMRRIKFAETKKQRTLSGPELVRLGDAIRQCEEGIEWAESEGPNAKHAAKRPENRITRIDPAAAAAVRLLLFTGARRGEILSLRWSEVDLDRNVLNLADSKTGAKAITINAEAKAILSDLAADRRGRTYVIAGEDDAPRWDLNRPWRMITKAAGLEGFRLHDLRHQYATTGVSLGASLFIVGHLLGHANIATTERYAHAEDEPMLAAANIIGATLAKAIGRR